MCDLRYNTNLTNLGHGTNVMDIMELMMQSQPRIGYWLSSKKKKKLKFEEFEELCKEAGIEIVQIDLEAPLADQGPFDVILHKVTDELVIRAEEGDVAAETKMNEIQEFGHEHPEVVVLDPLDQTLRLRDRYTMFTVLQQCNIMQSDHNVFVPATVELQTKDVETNCRLIASAGLTYPVLCKPSLADGTDNSHVMLIVFNEESLQDIEPPCVAQTLINHDGVLHKIFVIGDRHYIVQRPSLKNLSAGAFQPEKFHTRDVSKPDSTSHLNDHSLRRQNSFCSEPDPVVLSHIASSLRQTLKLDLFGVDVVIDSTNGKYAVIDVNPFPGYDGVEDFPKKLLQHIQERMMLVKSDPPNSSDEDAP